MNFGDILDDIARPRRAGGGEDLDGRAGPSPAFWSVLDSLAASAPASDSAVRQAYSPDAPAPKPLPEFDGTLDTADLSLEPDDIADELDLDAVSTLEELSVLRRRFARLNHPDRVEAGLRERANVRMTLANAMIDAAAARLSA